MTAKNATSKKPWKLLLGDKTFTIRTEHQEQLLKLIVLTAVPMLLGFAIFNEIFDFQTLASIQFAIALLFIPLMFSCCFHKIFSIHMLETIILCSGIIVFHSLLIFKGYANSSLYWIPIFPFLAFFTVGLYRGWYWVSAFFII
jgi:hypothetical protein